MNPIQWPIGYIPLRNEWFSLDMPMAVTRHVTLLGVTGSGKTTTIHALAYGAVQAGMGLCIVDAKGGSLRGVARRIAEANNLPYSEVVPGELNSMGYNPCAVGDPAQIADKLVSAFSTSPNGEIYRLIGQEAISIVVRALQTLQEPVTVRSVRQALDVSRMAGFASRLTSVNKRVADDLKELSNRKGVTKDALEGMRSRLGALLQGTYGTLFDIEDPLLDLYGAFSAPGVTYISLPALAVTQDTALMARVLIQDLKQVAYRRLQDPSVAPAMVVMDEFAALGDPEQINDLLRQAREAQMCCVVSTQNLPDAASAYALRAALLGNGVIIAHRIGHDDSEAVANIIGTEKKTDVTQAVKLGKNTGEGTVHRVDRYIINPNDIKQLGTGEAVVLATVGKRRNAKLTMRSMEQG